MASLFVYGTLRDPSVVTQVIGRALPLEPAQILGYRRVAPPGSYPYITPAPGHVVHGVLLRDIDREALGALDRYEEEGQLYRRAVVEVIVAKGREKAFTYVGIPSAHPPSRQTKGRRIRLTF